MIVQSRKDVSPAKQCQVSRRCNFLSIEDTDEGLENRNSSQAAEISDRAVVHGMAGLYTA